VANGTPAELRQRSDWAGAVTARFGNVANGSIKQKLSQLGPVKRVDVLEEKAAGVLVRIYPRENSKDLAGSVATLSQAEKWSIQELHTEEGRLDEVFRNITMPDTTQQSSSN